MRLSPSKKLSSNIGAVPLSLSWLTPLHPSSHTSLDRFRQSPHTRPLYYILADIQSFPVYSSDFVPSRCGDPIGQHYFTRTSS
ncbi:hypothetical protein PtB15_17B61 [Puccinia triticina]|nr:hypothetical protein PtB15_17B61 [Puccinia triticina]